MFQQVGTQRRRVRNQLYINFQNSKALEPSVGYSNTEYQLMQNFLDNFHQVGKYSAQIAIHQTELNREKNC